MTQHTLELFNEPFDNPPEVHKAVADIWGGLLPVAAYVGGGALLCQFTTHFTQEQIDTIVAAGPGAEWKSGPVGLRAPIFTRHSDHAWHAKSDSVK